jgi:hypothetical protein
VFSFSSLLYTPLSDYFSVSSFFSFSFVETLWDELKITASLSISVHEGNHTQNYVFKKHTQEQTQER